MSTPSGDRTAIHAYMTTPEAEHRFAVVFRSLGKALKTEDTFVRLTARERITLAVLTALDEDAADPAACSNVEVPSNSPTAMAH